METEMYHIKMNEVGGYSFFPLISILKYHLILMFLAWSVW